MKTLATLSILFFSIITIRAQAPYLNLVVEEITIPEPALTELSAVLSGSAYTIRVYANIPEEWEIQVMYGFSVAPLSVVAPEGFYHNNIGGPTSADIVTSAFAIDPLLEYDSWITIGWDNSIDNGLEEVPVDAPFLNDWEAGGDLISDDFLGGSIVVTTLPQSFPPNTADANGNVLVGQFTSDGPINGCLNFQVRRLNPDGTVFDPSGSAVSETVEFNNVCFNFSPPPIEGDCVGDLTGDNQVGTADLLVFTSQVGCQSDCIADFTGDDKTTGSDVLIFLSVYGNSCTE